MKFGEVKNKGFDAYTFSYYNMYYRVWLDEEIMTISLRLEKELENKFNKIAQLEGKTKSDLIRALISEFVEKSSEKHSPWELGKDVFGKYASGRTDRSLSRKKILKEKLLAKKNRH